MKKPDHPPVAYVEWRDAQVVESHWADRQKVIARAREMANLPMCASGFVLVDDGDIVVLTSEYNPDNDDVGGTVSIPRSEITAFRIIAPARGFDKQ